jgi:hypothetical protein
MAELSPIEAMNEFYRLKDKYETTYYEKYIKPILKSNKSKREKRVDFSKLPKNECINCKRNVGTIFSITNDNADLLRKFIAKCGDLSDPCPLDIQINLAQRELFSTTIKEGLAEIEKIKLQIIEEKNNAIFFNKDVVSIFETITSNLKQETEQTGFLIETNLLRNDNPEKKQLLSKTIDEFSKSMILPFKNMITDYNETNNELILNQAVNFYVNEMVPKLKEIMEMKYNIIGVKYETDEGIYKLIQLPNSIESQEFYITSDDKVIKYVRGVKKQKTRKLAPKDNITKAKTINKTITKNKTKKIKPTANLILQDEEVDEGQEKEDYRDE